MMSWCATQIVQLATPCTSLSKSGIPRNSNENRGGPVEIRSPSSIQIDSNSNRRRLGIGVRSSSSDSITMRRDRSKNRKPLQRGRNLSIEAIQTIQALKRAKKKIDEDEGDSSLQQVFDSNFSRLLKLDMMAVLRELLRQNQCLLSLKVFMHVRKEYWYKPQVSLYAEMISVLGNNGLFDKLELVFRELKMESTLEPDTGAFNLLLESLISFKMTELTKECFYLMKSLGCEPDKSTFRILVNGLESIGETSLSAAVRQEAQKYYGKSLEFLEEQEEIAMN